MRLSSDDLAMFFEPAHAALAERLREAAPRIAQAEPAPEMEAGGLRPTAGPEMEAGGLRPTAGPEMEAGGLRPTAGADAAAAEALARAGLFELVAPDSAIVDARAVC